MSQKDSQIDSLDREILKIMQRCNRTTSDQIAESVGLSPAAVQRRLKKLRQISIIQSDVSIINQKAVDLALTIVVQVKLESERADLIDSFKKQMKANTHVQQCYYVTGNADFILIVTASTMDDYNNLTHKMFFDNKNIKSFQSNVVMDPVKVGLSLPLEDL